jgi:hypothetical protein
VNLGVGLSSFPLLVGGAYLGGLTGAVWALAINMAINWLLNHLALRKEAARFHVAFTLRQCTAEWPVLWQFSLPVVAAGIMVAPAQWICNAFLVNQEGGYAQMGVFSAVMIFQTTILFAGEMLSAPLLAMLCNAEGQVSDRLGRVNMLSSWCIAVMVIVPLLCFPEIAELLFGKAYGGAAFRTTFVLMMFYTCILMFKQGLARVLAANSLMWWGFLSNSIWAVVAIGLAWHLVAWGAMGLAASFAIAYAVNTLLLVPLYHFRRLVPSGTLVSAESLVIWGILAILTLLGMADVSLLVRGIALVPSLLFVAIAFVRIAKPRLQAEA